jgi:hypothetical protein
VTFISQSEIDDMVAHGPWRELERIAALAVADAERAAHSVMGMNPVLGGGTRLMLAMKHRISDGVDLFIHDVQWIGYLTPRKNDFLEDRITGYEEGGSSLKLRFKEGQIDFIARTYLLDGLPSEKTPDCRFELEHPAEVLAKKLFHRGWALTPRDLFDWKALEDRYTPEELHIEDIAKLLKGQAKLDLIETSLKAIKDSSESKRRWEDIRTPSLPNYEKTIDWALSRLEQFRLLHASQNAGKQSKPSRG